MFFEHIYFIYKYLLHTKIQKFQLYNLIERLLNDIFPIILCLLLNQQLENDGSFNKFSILPPKFYGDEKNCS